MNEPKMQHSDRRFVDSGIYRSFTTERKPLEYMRSFNATTGDTINLYKDSGSKELPQMTQMSSIQKSQNFVENYSTNTDVLTRSILDEMRTQQRSEKPISQPIPVTFSHNRTNVVKDDRNDYGTAGNHPFGVGEENIKTINPVQSVVRSSTNQDVDDLETNQEEKTVTIKRKITRRHKGGEKPNLLRDSYIERISLPITSYENSTDSDDDLRAATDAKPNIPVSEIIPLNHVQVNEKLPTIFEPSLTVVQEEKIIPQIKGNVKAGLPYEKLSNLEKNGNSSYEAKQNDDWEYREKSVPQVQSRRYQSNNLLSDENTQEIFINEKQTAPTSTYSARKENMKSLQILDERSSVSRPLQSERNSSHRNEMTEEIETITLQPIGKGVHDLAPPPSATISRPASRAATPRIYDGGAGTVRTNFYKEDSKQIGNYNTMPAAPKFVKTNSVRNVDQTSNYDLGDYKRTTLANRASNERAYNTSFNRTSNDQVRGGSTSRGHNDQTLSTSWHTRTESTGEGNRGYNWPLTPTIPRSPISNIIVTSADENFRCTLQMVLNSEEQWYQPHLSRDEVTNILRNKEPGSFFIRNSSTFTGSYGLAVKVSSLPHNAVGTSDPHGDLVRHFLIDTVEDPSGNGVRLKGFDNELVYPSLAHLVQAHCQHPIALPTRLILPQSVMIKVVAGNGAQSKSQYQSQYQSQYEQHQLQGQLSTKAPLLSQSHRSLSSPGVNFSATNHPNPLHQYLEVNAIYLGKVETDRLTGNEAIQAAVDKIMNKSSVKSTTVVVTLDSTKGISLKDKMEKLFYTRQFPAQHVLYAGFDPKQRLFASQLPHNNGTNRRIIGIVVRKQKMILRENAVHLFCEMDDPNTVNDIIAFINENYLRRA